MPLSRARVLTGAALAAATLAGCGTVQVKSASVGASGSRGRIDNPLTHQPDHVGCLRAKGLQVNVVSLTDLVVGSGPNAVRVHFDATPGVSQGDQLQDHEQAAEVIGSALLYPGDAPDAQLTVIEHCIAQGVKG